MVSNHLPSAGEDFVLLLRGDCGVEVEGGGQGPGTGDVGIDQRRLNEGHRIWVADSIVRQRRKELVVGRVTPVVRRPSSVVVAAAKTAAAGQARAPVPTWSEGDTNWLTKFVRGDVSFQSE